VTRPRGARGGSAPGPDPSRWSGLGALRDVIQVYLTGVLWRIAQSIPPGMTTDE
jgi:hypothetical protein